MTTVVELNLSPEAFILSETVADHPGIELAVVRATAHPSVLAPIFWVFDADFDALTASLESDPTVRGVELVASFDGERLYRAEDVEHGELLRYLVCEKGATVQRASLSGGRWRFRALFDEQENVSGLFDFSRRQGLDVRVDRVYPLSELHRAGLGLSEAQYEAIGLALTAGYYDIPREATIADLAGDLDISSQALSERLRRAHGALVREAVLPRFDEQSLSDSDPLSGP
ncbi:helix-turn-helix domain-containing protein [Halegenticoccus soli]|uniref:helix-turn-helix domain-containing protein n=1 Tax=Halegenticoccus soli TaxID=1985678 RepID=UPI000C6D8457|nr:helix-turn-helix domain-containing protein [Halegenticoccus soli]